jgi:DNA primase
MIDSDKVYTYFEDNHGPLSRATNGWYEATCPFCGKRKLAINPEKFTVKCWKKCFYGSAVYFVKQYLNCSYFDANSIIDDQVPGIQMAKYMDTLPATVKKELVLPEGFTTILNSRTPMGKRAQRYLKDRGFNLNYLDMIGVGIAQAEKYFGYIIIPFKRDGDVIYFIARDFMDRGDKVRYKNPPWEEFGIGKSEVLFNEEALYLYDKVYIMEGWADAATMGNNGSSIQGKSLNPQQCSIILKSPVKEVVVISDIGAEMDALTILEPIYKTKRTKLIKLSKFDNIGKDVNDIGADKVLEIEETTNYITNLSDFHDEARSINSHKKKLLI